MFSQFNLHNPSSTDKFSLCKARLFELSNEYSSLCIDRDFLSWQSVHFQNFNYLKSRSDIYITKTDKGSGMVTLNSLDYIGKMEFFYMIPQTLQRLVLQVHVTMQAKIQR